MAASTFASKFIGTEDKQFWSSKDWISILTAQLALVEENHKKYEADVAARKAESLAKHKATLEKFITPFEKTSGTVKVGLDQWKWENGKLSLVYSSYGIKPVP